MAEFSILLEGKADADAVREAFNGAVGSIRDAADEAFELTGELIVDGVKYGADDVPETEAADTTDAADETDDDEGEAVPV